MDMLDARSSTVVLIGIVVVLCLVFDIVRRGSGAEGLFRKFRRDRVGFPLSPRSVLPFQGDGPGRYCVTGVVERTGEPTRFDVEAAGATEAMRAALDRGVSPSTVTKLST